jgi:hypothetical protein
MPESPIDTDSLIAEISRINSPLEKLEKWLPAILEFLSISYDNTDELNPADTVSVMTQALQKKLELDAKTIPIDAGFSRLIRTLYLQVAWVKNTVRTGTIKWTLYNPFAYLRDLADYLQDHTYSSEEKMLIAFSEKYITKSIFGDGVRKKFWISEKDILLALRHYAYPDQNILGGYVGWHATETSPEEITNKLLERVNEWSLVWEIIGNMFLCSAGKEDILYRCGMQILTDNRTRPHMGKSGKMKSVLGE